MFETDTCLWVVCGPSSVGKSTFIESGHGMGYMGISSDVSFIPAYQWQRLNNVTDPVSIYHYNMLRMLEGSSRDDKHGKVVEQTRYGDTQVFCEDPGWKVVLDYDGPKKVIVLVTSQQELLRRVKKRTIIESRLGCEPYPQEYWSRMIRSVNMLHLYQSWINMLECCRIPYSILDSSSRQYRIVPDMDAVAPLLYSLH